MKKEKPYIMGSGINPDRRYYNWEENGLNEIEDFRDKHTYYGIELRPCPFCGEKPFFNDMPTPPYGLGVSCINPHCVSNSPENWNTRPIEDELRAEILRLKRTIYDLLHEGEDD